MSSCAFAPCHEVERCSLSVCVVRNPLFVQPRGQSDLKASAPAFNGTKAARDDVHPSAKARKRKEIHRTGAI